MQGYGQGKKYDMIILLIFYHKYNFFGCMIITTYINIFWSYLDKYDYQHQEAWDHYDEKWDPYHQRQQGQGYQDQYTYG